MTVLRQRLRRMHTTFRRRVLVYHRLLAALMAGLAVYLVVVAMSPRPAPTVPIWVAARDLPSGTVLGPDDLRRAAFRPGTRPDGTVGSATRAVGGTLAAPLARGEPVERRDLVGAHLLEGRPGETAVPVRVTDPDVVALLRVGDRVDLVTADPQGRAPARVVARAVTVLALPRGSEREAAAGLPGRLVVVAVPEEEAVAVAGDTPRSYLTVTWQH
jgi:Flp pilus assembly protein CpaB